MGLGEQSPSSCGGEHGFREWSRPVHGGSDLLHERAGLHSRLLRCDPAYQLCHIGIERGGRGDLVSFSPRNHGGLLIVHDGQWYHSSISVAGILLLGPDTPFRSSMCMRLLDPRIVGKPLTQLDFRIRSSKLPGGDLVSAVLNRQVMGLADRGGSSGLVGQRWADVCADWVDNLVGTTAHIPMIDGEPFQIERVARLDHLPRIASVASKRGLQNPDIVFIGHRAGRSVLQAADAKFSIETARSKQGSPEVVEALLQLGSLIRSLTGELTEEIEFIPGVFLSPDYPLTHLMLQGRHGITRATARPVEVILVPVDAGRFFSSLPMISVTQVLAGVDSLPVSLHTSLLAGLYYFRLSRAIVGSWVDSVKPLLTFNDRNEVDEDAVLIEAVERARGAQSAFDLVLTWDAEVETIRARRAAVEQVAGLPIMTRDLRTAIAIATKGKVEEGPPVNQVRRRLGAWFRGELREIFGPIPPSEPDFPEKLKELGKASAEIAEQIPEQANRVILDLLAERKQRTPGTEDDEPVETLES